MKYIGTVCSLCGEIRNIVAEKLNDKYNHHSQFRIVCKARGIKHANKLTSWVIYNAFRRDYCSETKNKTELSFFEKDSNVNFVIGSSPGRYITDIELKALLQAHSTQKGDWVGEEEAEKALKAREKE